MALIDQDVLKHYLKLNYNVLFIGGHGIGKTAIIKEVFESAGLKWKYFSCSTLDPWIDLIGIPRVVENPDGEHYMELVPPLFIQHDGVEAFFFR